MQLPRGEQPLANGPGFCRGCLLLGRVLADGWDCWG